MSNAKAVYTAKRSITAGKFAKISQDYGLELRYLQPGGIPFSRYADNVLTKGLTNPLNRALLVAAADADQAPVLADLDAAITCGDRSGISDVLNSFSLAWFELYSQRFSFEKDIATAPRLKKWVGQRTDEQLRQLKTASTRYILYNQARQKECGKLVRRLANCLAEHTEGLVLTHRHAR